jgi:hypothetical protein
MTTKLTLSIESSVIEQAKNYAKAHNKSLSRLIENYLKSLSEPKEAHVQEPSILYGLKGSFSDNDATQTDQEVLQHALSNKYLKK